MKVRFPAEFALLAAALGLATACARPVFAGQADRAPVEFNRDIRPILSDNCYQCHGPDKAQRKADLRLDTEAGATADLGGRRAVVAGVLEQSELYQRLVAEDENERMPPLK